MILLRSLVYLAFMSLSVVLFSVPIAVFGWFVPYPWLGKAGNLWGRLNLAALDKICHLRYRVRGWENFPKRPCVILCKHQSTWETIALRALLPPEHIWVLKRELLWVPFFGWALAPFRPIAINRKDGRGALRQLLDEGRRALDHGHWIVIFPEGTRVAPGERIRYGFGGALLAEKTGYPVLPIAHNAGTFWRRRDIRKHPGTIDLVIGEVMDTSGTKASEINRRIESWIEETVTSLPGAHPPTP
jgi:1-acyl-sn-glycerol-3-phosphate acyltransferase